jgi:hypothetical protein
MVRQPFSRDKDTIYLDYTNLYSKKLNSCFIWVEEHSRDGQDKLLAPWCTYVSVWNVYENSKYGDFIEHHNPGNEQLPQSMVICDLGEKSCSSLKEFQGLTQSYFDD